MGVESGSPLERARETRGYKIWGNRDPINRLTSLRIDLARWMEKPLVPPSRTVEHVTADRVTRKEVLKWAAGALLVGGAGFLVWLDRKSKKRFLTLERLLNPEYKADFKGDIGERRGWPAVEKEIFQLYILDEPEGAKVLCKDIAILSRSVNRDTYEDVVFEDYKTWGRSELYELVKHYARLMGHLKTVSGREQIKKGIDEHGGAYKDHYYGNLAKLEGWIEEEGLKADLSPDQLEEFFTDELKYSKEAWGILQDLESAWHKKDFRGDLKERINQFNEKNKVEFKISSQKESPEMVALKKDARIAGEIIRESGLDKVIDAEEIVAVAQRLPAGYELHELHAAVGGTLPPPPHVLKPPEGKIDIALAFGITLGYLARESPKLKEWAKGQLEKLKK